MTHLQPERRATTSRAQRWPTQDLMPSQTEWVAELAGQESAEQAGKREEIVGHEQSTHRNQNPAGDHIDHTTPSARAREPGRLRVDGQAVNASPAAEATSAVSGSKTCGYRFSRYA